MLVRETLLQQTTDTELSNQFICTQTFSTAGILILNSKVLPMILNKVLLHLVKTFQLASLHNSSTLTLFDLKVTEL